MKTLLLSIFFTFVSLISQGQTVYRAVTAELHFYNKSTDDWTLNTKYSDLKIDITVEEKYISINAKSPSMYRVLDGTKEDVNTKSFTGYRYSARDLKTDELVKIDILKHVESGVVVLSIINMTQGFNLRYFIDMVN
jgi:hypothetical protein